MTEQANSLDKATELAEQLVMAANFSFFPNSLNSMTKVILQANEWLAMNREEP